MTKWKSARAYLAVGFSLVELLASIAIIALIVVSAGVFVANYIGTAQLRADQQTLQTLNDALTRYKTQGGGTSGLTLGAPIGNIIDRLKQPISWAGGLSHQVLNSAFTVPSRSLDATGTGSAYRFYSYGTYTENAPASGAATTNMPYGEGVGYVAVDGSSGLTISCDSTTGYWAIRTSGGTTYTYDSSEWSLTAGGAPIPGTSFTFWACTGPFNSTPSGTITTVYANEADTYGYFYLYNISALDVRGLTSLQYLNCGINQMSSLKVAGVPTLQTLMCADNQLTSLDLSGLSSLETLECNTNQLAALNLSGLTSLTSVSCSDNQISTLNVAGLSNLQTLFCSGNQLTSLNLSGLTSLQNLQCYGNQLTSLSLSTNTNLLVLDCAINQLTSLDISALTSLQTANCYNNQLTSITWPNAPNLSDAKVYHNTALTGSTMAINSLYSTLPNLSGGIANRLYLAPTAPSATDATATGKGWTVMRAY
jgi:type II secretory pathway pseudopilin PulG